MTKQVEICAFWKSEFNQTIIGRKFRLVVAHAMLQAEWKDVCVCHGHDLPWVLPSTGSTACMTRHHSCENLRLQNRLSDETKKNHSKTCTKPIEPVSRMRNNGLSRNCAGATQDFNWQPTTLVSGDACFVFLSLSTRWVWKEMGQPGDCRPLLPFQPQITLICRVFCRDKYLRQKKKERIIRISRCRHI